jgi:uncharacterized protein (DUF58 family)
VTGPVWRPTPALRRGLAMVALALLGAAALGRVEPVLLAVPFALGTAWSLTRRPDAPVRASLTLDEPTSVEGGPVAARVVAGHDHPEPLLCVVNAQVPPWFRLRHGVGHYAALVGPGDPTAIRLQGTVHRWGSYQLGPATVRAVAADGLLAAEGESVPAVPLPVYPAAEPFDSREMLPRAAGVTGIHRSRRPGEGGELAGVRPFQAGDRLRRIDWRVTVRTGEVHVTSTLSERDADVVLLLDLRQEAGVSGGLGGAASVLDSTVRAAAAITEHYVHQGDRVALLEYGQRLRRIPAGSGVRHYLAVLEWLVTTSAGPTGHAPGFHLLVRGLQPPNALVVVLTPLLDDESANLLANLVRAGRPLVAVDTLPPAVAPLARGTPWAAEAARLWRLERANTLGRLRDVGVPVQAWQGAGSLDLVLRDVGRLVRGRR